MVSLWARLATATVGNEFEFYGTICLRYDARSFHERTAVYAPERDDDVLLVVCGGCDWWWGIVRCKPFADVRGDSRDGGGMLVALHNCCFTLDAAEEYEWL